MILNKYSPKRNFLLIVDNRLKSAGRCVKIKSTKFGSKTMSRIEKLILRGAGFTVLFMLIYFTLAAIMGFGGEGMSTGRFFLILLFGYILAMANFVFENAPIKIWLKRLCVYAISALAFFFIFVLGTAVGETGAKIFAAMVIFTAIYGIGLLVAILIGRTLVEYKPSGRKKSVKSEKKTDKKPYKPLYKD